MPLTVNNILHSYLDSIVPMCLQSVHNQTRGCSMDHAVEVNTKLRLFNSKVKLVLLYGEEETRRHTKDLEHTLQLFLNTCLPQILHISLSDGQTGSLTKRRSEEQNRNLSLTPPTSASGEGKDTPCTKTRPTSLAMLSTGSPKAKAKVKKTTTHNLALDCGH